MLCSLRGKQQSIGTWKFGTFQVGRGAGQPMKDHWQLSVVRMRSDESGAPKAHKASENVRPKMRQTVSSDR